MVMEQLTADGDHSGRSKMSLLEAIYSEAIVKEFWGPIDDKTKRAVEAAAEVNRNNILSKNVSKRLSKTERQYLKGASASDLENILQTYLNRAIGRQEDLENSTLAMARAERSTSKFLRNFHEYAKAYCGVIQLMNGAGAGYGDTAYGALTLFLVVAVNKTQTEEILNSMMSKLQQQYCRIKIVNKVYNSERMKEHTALVYRLGIEFLYIAVRYYSMNTLQRIWYVITQPPSIRLESKISDIQSAIEEMRMEMEVLDGFRLNGMESTLGEVEKKVVGTAEDVQALRVQADNARLEFMQHLLGIGPNLTANFLDEYEALLSERFDSLRGLPAFDVKTELYTNEDFQRWRREIESGLFVLRGATVAPSRTDLSWISPGAVGLVKEFEELFRPQPPLLLHFFCRLTDEWSAKNQKIIPKVLLSSFIFQILRSEYGKHILHNEDAYAEVKFEIQSAINTASQRVTEGVTQLYDVMQKLLSRTGVQRVVIVVDRLDEIQGDLERFTDPLLKMLKRNEIKTKAFLTVGSSRSLKASDMSYVLGECNFCSLVIDQDRN